MSNSHFIIREHSIPTAHIREYPRATADDQEDVLQLAIKQYIPVENQHPQPGDITIIGAHANGFPKELYEPLWDELHDRLKAKSIQIRGIWIADVAWQGQSGVLNEHKLGSDPSWLDHSRDLFLMVNHFRKEIKRPLFGIGHSMGGGQLINLSSMHPRLFTSLILIDPVVQRKPNKSGNFAPAKASTKRRDRWPSRKDAEVAFKKSKFYQTWDPRVLDMWVRYGLRDLPTKLYPQGSSGLNIPSTNTENTTDKEVTLTTTKHQEVMTFLRGNFPTASNPNPWTQANPETHPDVDYNAPPIVPFYRPDAMIIFQKLPFLRPSVLYIFGETSYLSSAALKADKMEHTGTGVGGSGGATAGRVKSITIDKVGHLIPMENVAATAESCTEWIVPEFQRWQALEEAEQKAWGASPKEQKGLMSDEYIRVMKSDWSQYDAPPHANGSKL